VLGNLALLLLCLIFSAVFSAIETAFTSLPPHRISFLADNRGLRGRTVARLARNPGILLTTILIGNNLANIGAAALVTLLTEHLLGTRFISIMSGVLTLIVLIFCEVTPKRIAIMRNETIALATSIPLRWLSIIFRPVVLAVSWISSVISRFFSSSEKEQLSMAEIMNIVTIGETEGVLKKYEGRMVRRVFHLDDLTVKTVMTPRVDVFSVSSGAYLSDIVADIEKNGFSRIPVFEGNEENVVGVLLAKEMLGMLSKGRQDVRVKEIMKEPIFVPETFKLNKLFSTFLAERSKIAIVIDEYGGFSGVTTLEDIAEEVFGEIFDETDPTTFSAIHKIGDNRYRLSPDSSLPMIESSLGISFPGGAPDQTVSGYILERLERMPRRGDTLELGKHRMIVERVRRHRVRSVALELSNL